MKLLLTSLLLALFAGIPSTRATVILGSHDWNSGSEGWTAENDWVDLTRPADGGVDNTGYLRLSFQATGTTPPNEWYDIVRVNAKTLFAGSWDERMWVEFSFFSEDVTPNALRVVFEGAREDLWSFSGLTPLGTGTWNRYATPFSYESGWSSPGQNEADFLDALQSIEWIGVYVQRTGEGAQNYGLDDFNLMIPEPEEYAMAAGGLLICLLALRNRGKKGLILRAG